MYPESLHSISGSSSDEVSIEGGRLHDGAVPTTSSPFSSDQGSDVMVSASVSTTSSTSSSSTTTTTTTSSPSDTPQSTNPTNPTDSTKTTTNAALDQLWPQLVELIEPFNLRRRQTPAEKGRVDAERVRKQADDLRDSREVDVPGEGKKVVAR